MLPSTLPCLPHGLLQQLLLLSTFTHYFTPSSQVKTCSTLPAMAHEWGVKAQVGPGKVAHKSFLGGVEPLMPASRSWDGQCLIAKESSFGSQGWF